MIEALSYDDVLLSPEYSTLSSRTLGNTSVNLCGWMFDLPIIPSNMEDVINVKLAKYFSENNLFYIMHRFSPPAPLGDLGVSPSDITYKFLNQANKENWRLISISTGVNEDSLNILKFAKNAKWRIDFVTIDVAHGHHSKVRSRIQWIKENLPNSKIIAGNIATSQAYYDLVCWGTDVVKVGIGQGSICTTRFQTGFSVPMFTCVKSISESIFNPQKAIPIIADGGIKRIGDIAKAIRAGATMIMSGKLFASCVDSPAKVLDNKKQYRGSTSFAAKKVNKHIEGRLEELEPDISVKDRLLEIKESLQSSISYGGGKNLDCLKKVRWVRTYSI